MKLLLYCLFGALVLLNSRCDRTTSETEDAEVTASSEAEVATRSNENAMTKTFTARGNEPFWNVTIAADTIVFHRMGEEKVYFPYAEPQQDGNSWVFQTTKSGAGNLTITITPGECTDSMSGEEFEYSATLEVDGEAYKGCAQET